MENKNLPKLTHGYLKGVTKFLHKDPS